MNTLFEDENYIHVYIHEHEFCINVTHVQDVLSTPILTNIPLSPPHVCGLMNLRGRVVTAIDMGIKLGLPSVIDQKSNGMSVIIEFEGELYSLIFSKIGEVISLDKKKIELNANAVDPRWRDYSSGIYLQNKQIIVILDVGSLMKQFK